VLSNMHLSKQGRTFWLSVALVTLTAIGTLLFYATGILTTPNRHEDIAARGAQVMPFDLEKTVHFFEKLDDGGLQKVVVKEPSNKEQISLIQAHLKKESERFRRGDFSDPAKIHGEDMPGLPELKSGVGNIEVVYTSLPDGAQIRYTSESRPCSWRSITGSTRSFPTTADTLRVPIANTRSFHKLNYRRAFSYSTLERAARRTTRASQTKHTSTTSSTTMNSKKLSQSPRTDNLSNFAQTSSERICTT